MAGITVATCLMRSDRRFISEWFVGLRQLTASAFSRSALALTFVPASHKGSATELEIPAGELFSVCDRRGTESVVIPLPDP